ncbi:MAG: hypothetical protein KIT11_05450 [Fimbriimonadaceae bacterium]|nr:hypothetical protein [Fimbriimonadaceae bacterium]QYK56662.1 MAG: hypothetical protein KF733_04070 [Fimbriimonadaceae bacterium]
MENTEDGFAGFVAELDQILCGPPDDAGTVLEAARTLVYGDRQRAYGKARENHERIAKVWEAVLGVPISAEQVVACMAGLKLARIAGNLDHRDSWVDLAGYAAVWDKIKRGE